MICNGRRYVWITYSNNRLISGRFCARLLVLRTRVHAFIAMLIAAAIAGLIGGMNVDQTLGAITKGFGGTLGLVL